ncbi:hypothetical protein KA005_42485, partial [bacterium]|nr:hypothetical protein [bacterium]
RTLVNSVVLKSLDSLGVEKHIQYNPKRIKKMKDISVRRIAKSRSIGISYGRVITDANKPLEYGENSNFVIYGSFPTPFRSESWYTYVRIMPMLTWDWGNNTLENLFQGTSTTSVHLISGFLMLVRKFWPERSVESYIGLGVGFLWLRRIYGEEYNFLHAPAEVHPGFAVTLGGEFKMGQKYRFIIPLKFYHSAFWSFKAEDINGRHFNGGPLWGINIGIGLARYF